MAQDKNSPVLKLAADNVVPLDEDWLTALPRNTIFLAKSKDKFVLAYFKVAFKWKRAIVLIPFNDAPIYVDPKEFCKTFDKYEVIGEEEDG